MWSIAMWTNRNKVGRVGQTKYCGWDTHPMCEYALFLFCKKGNIDQASTFCFCLPNLLCVIVIFGCCL